MMRRSTLSHYLEAVKAHGVGLFEDYWQEYYAKSVLLLFSDSEGLGNRGMSTFGRAQQERELGQAREGDKSQVFNGKPQLLKKRVRNAEDGNLEKSSKKDRVHPNISETQFPGGD